MNKTSPKISAKFPEGYGDFAIRSSDGVVCYFPKYTLIHASSVFRDMLELGSTSSPKLVVDVEEPATVLEDFLIHLSSGPIHPIDHSTIEQLLRMSDKYQVDSIMEWFEKEAVCQRRNQITSTIDEAFLIRFPLLTLSLAIRYNLISTIKGAFREVAYSDVDVLLQCPDSLGISVFQELCQKRSQQIERYMTWIEFMADHGPLQNRRMTGVIHSSPRVNDRSPLVNRDGSDLMTCVHCTGLKAKWLIQMGRAVQKCPKWTSFINVFEEPRSCGKCHQKWDQYFRPYIRDWEKEALREEKKLPNWPPKENQAPKFLIIPYDRVYVRTYGIFIPYSVISILGILLAATFVLLYKLDAIPISCELLYH